jgi:hypothetical protein
MVLSLASIPAARPTATSCSATRLPDKTKLDEWSAQSLERCEADSLANLESVTKEVRAFVASEFLDSKEEV